MPAISGFGGLAASTLNITTQDPGLVDGRAVPALSEAVTAATTGGKFRGFLVSEDGDGTYTVTQTADDSHDDAATALTAALDLAVPAGGIGIVAGSVSSTAVQGTFSLAVQGKEPEVSDEPGTYTLSGNTLTYTELTSDWR